MGAELATPEHSSTIAAESNTGRSRQPPATYGRRTYGALAEPRTSAAAAAAAAGGITQQKQRAIAARETDTQTLTYRRTQGKEKRNKGIHREIPSPVEKESKEEDDGATAVSAQQTGLRDRPRQIRISFAFVSAF